MAASFEEWIASQTSASVPAVIWASHSFSVAANAAPATYRIFAPNSNAVVIGGGYFFDGGQFTLSHGSGPDYGGGWEVSGAPNQAGTLTVYAIFLQTATTSVQTVDGIVV